mgnify:CR=1 FL=1
MRAVNKRARVDYQIFEQIEAGMVLRGGEAKAVRTGHIDISRSYAKIIGGEVYLINAVIPISGAQNYDSSRTRKILLHKSEIIELTTKMKQKKLTIVPISVYTKGSLVKVKLGLARSKRKFEKKQTLKQRDIERELEREIKER